MDLFNFDRADAVSQLLQRIGIQADLDTFLADHLTTVLRKQHRDIEIVSIKFLSAGNCSAGGQSISENVVSIDSLSMPIDVHVVLVAGAVTYELDLHIRIVAEQAASGYDVKTDVLVKRQWSR